MKNLNLPTFVEAKDSNSSYISQREVLSFDNCWLLPRKRCKFGKLNKVGVGFCGNIRTHHPCKLKLTSALSLSLLNSPQIIIREEYHLRSTLSLFSNYLSNLNASNKHHRRSRHKKIENIYDNLSTTLTGCFLGACHKDSASSSLSSKIFKQKYSGYYGSTMSVPSSILESESSGYSLVSQTNQVKADDTIFKINENYEVAPRSFCKISNTIIVDPPEKYVLQEDQDNSINHDVIVEVDCSSTRVSTRNTSSWDEVLSSDWSFTAAADIKMNPLDPMESRSILKRTLTPKSLTPAHLTFALGKNLVFEYPSYESLIDENNENNSRENLTDFQLPQRLEPFSKIFFQLLKYDPNSSLLLHLMSLSKECPYTCDIESELLGHFCHLIKSAQEILSDIQRIVKVNKTREMDVF